MTFMAALGPGSIICVHDVNTKQFPGVDKAVAELLPQFTIVAPTNMGAMVAVQLTRKRQWNVLRPATKAALRKNGVQFADAFFARQGKDITLRGFDSKAK